MNALELKKLLDGFSDNELRYKKVRVFINDDIREGLTIIADSCEIDDEGDVIINI